MKNARKARPLTKKMQMHRDDLVRVLAQQNVPHKDITCVNMGDHVRCTVTLESSEDVSHFDYKVAGELELTATAGLVIIQTNTETGVPGQVEVCIADQPPRRRGGKPNYEIPWGWKRPLPDTVPVPDEVLANLPGFMPSSGYTCITYTPHPSEQREQATFWMRNGKVLPAEEAAGISSERIGDFARYVKDGAEIHVDHLSIKRQIQNRWEFGIGWGHMGHRVEVVEEDGHVKSIGKESKWIS